jgi:hypothetical protein
MINTSETKSINPSLWIREVIRFPENGPEDRLSFELGVNVLVGVPNTGKSKWLRMIDYLFADDNKPAEVFEEEITEKYHSLRATIVVAGEDWTIERNWKDTSLITKISLNGELMTLGSFTAKLLEALHIPIVHYPQGNPYGPRTWPQLGWRSLYRHMYRRQGFWNDLAERQPESEQHACILQFVGVAEILFSEQYGKLVGLEKKIQQLQSAREQFVAMLQEVSRELIDEKELGVALTPDSIDVAIKRHEAEAVALQTKRDAMLEGLLHSTNTEADQDPSHMVEGIREELARLMVKVEGCALASNRSKERRAELDAHRGLITDELSRMERAIEAGGLLADLKITHCPACDQAVEQPKQVSQSCYLCHRPVDSSSEAATKRLDFELEQLKSEVKETDQLLAVLARDTERLESDRAQALIEIENLQSLLLPVRRAVASVLPPELTILDQKTGRLHERIAQLRRVLSTLEKREAIALDIEKIQAEVATLETARAAQSKQISFERASDLLSDGMNTYFNAINELKPNSWSQQEVDFVLHDRSFVIRIGKASWRVKLGGTLTLFFMVAYHYTLMTLTRKEQCHFPGICLLDFPAQLDGVTVSDSENFVLEPFLRLKVSDQEPDYQVIAAGSSFAGLKGAHRIELTKVWT